MDYAEFKYRVFQLIDHLTTTPYEELLSGFKDDWLEPVWETQSETQINEVAVAQDYVQKFLAKDAIDLDGSMGNGRVSETNPAIPPELLKQMG